jgi:NAD(P)-dependent dehydrogenase (short-subunit alcohol dehydrogenase family)
MMDRKTYLIVGGGVGIGKATAALLSGHRLILAGRTRAKLEAAQAELGGTVTVETVNFADPASVGALAARIGAIDGLVLCASSAVAFGPFSELETEAVRSAFDNKFWGYWMMAKAFLPHLAADGAVVMVAGAAGRAAMPGSTGVAVVNAAVQALAKVLACCPTPARRAHRPARGRRALGGPGPNQRLHDGSSDRRGRWRQYRACAMIGTRLGRLAHHKL